MYRRSIAGVADRSGMQRWGGFTKSPREIVSFLFMMV